MTLSYALVTDMMALLTSFSGLICPWLNELESILDLNYFVCVAPPLPIPQLESGVIVMDVGAFVCIHRSVYRVHVSQDGTEGLWQDGTVQLF